MIDFSLGRNVEPPNGLEMSRPASQS